MTTEQMYSLEDPFAGSASAAAPVLNPEAPKTEPAAIANSAAAGPYDESLAMGEDLLQRPLDGGGTLRVMVQHSKSRMTVWERIRLLADSDPNIMWQNWGPSLDGASLVTGIITIGGRDIAVYGHDFTLRAGSMDATNGDKLARLIYLAGEQGIPLIGMNDSAGAYVPAGVGGLDGYSEAFTALRKISGLVPSIMLMFGFNAGGGSYLPRQGSFMIQCDDTFFGLTGPGVVRQVLGEDISADELGGPNVHANSGVVDLTTQDELGSLRTAMRLLSYLPNNNKENAPFRSTSDPVDRFIYEEDMLFRRTFNSPTGMNTPMDITLYMQQLCDHGEYFELQPTRARNLVTAFGRIGGHVVGFIANNSWVASGQIDIGAARKATRFVRFCNIYNIPMLFIEDTTGFLPGKEQEHAGIVLEGRRLLDSIIDLRTPRLTVVIRNAFGGAYATFNSHYIGADMVFAFPTARVAVMGPAGTEYVYKNEIQQIHQRFQQQINSGIDEHSAERTRAAALAGLTQRYEKELMNPKEALSLGSVSRIILPGTSRQIIAENLSFLMRHYKPSAMSGIQREFE